MDELELELELRRVLRARPEPEPVPDPLPGVHRGIRRRRRLRQASFAGTALAVVGVVAGAALLVGPATHRSLPPAATTSPVQPTAAPTVTRPPLVVPPPDAGVPAGFAATDLSFVSATHGFAIGGALCPGIPCRALLATTDSGASWSRRSAPACTRGTCPTHVRFASDRIGYAWGFNGLFLTVDGGRSWSRQSGPTVYGLEVAHGVAVRVVTADACPGCRFVVQTSLVGSTVWQTTYTSSEQRTDAGLVRSGSRLAVPLYAHPSGGSSAPQTTSLLLSTDDGRSWVRRDDPCTTTGTEVDAAGVSFSPAGELVVLCRNRQAGTGTTLIVSADGGRTFGPRRTVPAIAPDAATGAGPGVLVAVGTTGSTTRLVRSGDAGATWQQVASEPAANGATTPVLLAFTSPSTGWWVGPSGRRLWRTTDGGRTWTSRSFR